MNDTIAILIGRITALESELVKVKTTASDLENELANVKISASESEKKLAKATVSPDGKEISITGANLNIRSGSGGTAGSVNGLGNLIVGYNEKYVVSGVTKSKHTGSHNLVIGTGNTYSSYGGLVAGYRNSITNSYSSVSAGQHNTASGEAASVSGGNSRSVNGASAWRAGTLVEID